jgi:outer membrane receptor protein involved in Fe transport
MNNKPSSALRAGLLVCSALLGIWPAVARSQEAPTPSVAQEAVKPAAAEETIVLSPFKVTTEKDNGYKATNATSGTRLNTPIKDLPMPLEVITEKFLRDTGSTDLRQSLRYSSGILLQSQNDQSVRYSNPGGVNNPEGATANPNNTTIKIRGYVTDTVLRDGYRRQFATDSVNIGRVEVIRGPAALLYGIGNFGGIVNYLPKEPEHKARGETTFSFGNFGFKRVSVDMTGPMTETWSGDYRVSAAWEDANDYTQYFHQKHYFVAPVFSFKPTKTTDIIVDFETGKMWQQGVGFKQIRAVAGVGINSDQNEHGGFVTFPGTNPRLFRWSGPDTYYNTEAFNGRFQITQKLAEGLTLLAGYNYSNVKTANLDVNGNFRTATGPTNLRGSVLLSPIDQVHGDSSGNVPAGTVNDAIFEYVWGDHQTTTKRGQSRVDLTYHFKLFQNSSKWLKMDNIFLVGDTIEQNKADAYNANTTDTKYNYKSPLDLTPIRFGQGVQNNGTAAGLAGDVAMQPFNRSLTDSKNHGDYAVYQGKFLDDRVTIVSGVRRDTNSLDVTNTNLLPGGTKTVANGDSQSKNTTQNGVSLQITRAISVYALKADGIQPNFAGNIDVNGKPMSAVLAKSNEFGVKIDLFDGRLSGTISSYKIKRTGTPILYWWAPTTNHVTFNPNKPIVYQNGFGTGADAGLSPTLYNAAVAVGNATPGQGIWTQGGQQYINASSATGAAFMDGVFDATKKNGGWPGWIYGLDSVTNNSWGAIATAGGQPVEYVSGEDSSKGWDAQLMFTPNKHLQIIGTYAHVKRVIDSAGKWAKYPYPQDRWAVWYFPNSDWGLANRPLNTVYTDPNDTSTWTGVGFGTGERQDDTPEHQFTLWANYQFDSGKLKGLSTGIGGYWESERQYMSGITHGGGQFITDKNGNRVILSTAPRKNVDFMVRYAFKIEGHDASVQLNVSNLLDDQKRYGLIYSAPRSSHIEFSYKF